MRDAEAAYGGTRARDADGGAHGPVGARDPKLLLRSVACGFFLHGGVVDYQTENAQNFYIEMADGRHPRVISFGLLAR